MKEDDANTLRAEFRDLRAQVAAAEEIRAVVESHYGGDFAAAARALTEQAEQDEWRYLLVGCEAVADELVEMILERAASHPHGPAMTLVNTYGPSMSGLQDRLEEALGTVLRDAEQHALASAQHALASAQHGPYQNPDPD